MLTMHCYRFYHCYSKKEVVIRLLCCCHHQAYCIAYNIDIIRIHRSQVWSHTGTSMMFIGCVCYRDAEKGFAYRLDDEEREKQT